MIKAKYSTIDVLANATLAFNQAIITRGLIIPAIIFARKAEECISATGPRIRDDVSQIWMNVDIVRKD